MTMKIIVAAIAAIVILGLILLCYFISENKKFRVVSYQVKSEKLPKAFKGTRFVFLTDLHGWIYGNDNDPLIEEIERQNPDYILIGGDMFVKGTEFDATVAVDLIMRLVSKYPVFYSFGNHELRISEIEETKDSTYLDYINTLKGIGVTFLVDDKITLCRDDERIEIIGLNLEEFYYKKFSKNNLTVDAIERHIGRPNENDFSILLAHNPRYFDEYAEWGADLVLSGHVHGGIIVLPFIGGVISTQGLLFPKYDFGEFRKGSSRMIISRGLGNHTVKIRFNNRAELSVITLG